MKEESAFPLSREYSNNGKVYSEADHGMTKRFYAACAAMQGILIGDEIARTGRRSTVSIIEMAYNFADELLKQENEES